MKCARCPAEFGFLDGFLTTEGMICATCKEIESLSKRLKGVLTAEDLAAQYSAITSAAREIDNIARLAKIDDSRRLLRTALCVRAYGEGVGQDDSGTVLSFEPDAEMKCDALAFLFDASPSPELAIKIITLGQAVRAAALIAACRPDLGKGWMAALESLNAAGEAQAAFNIALEYKSNQFGELYSFLANHLSKERVPALTGWIVRARFVSIDDRADFIRRCRDSASAKGIDLAALEPLEKAARGSLGGTGNELAYLERLGDSAELEALLAGLTRFDGEIMAYLRGLAGSGDREKVIALLSRGSISGPDAAMICDFVISLSPDGGSRDVMEILEKNQLWETAGEYLERSKPNEEERLQFRSRCRENLKKRETANLERLRRAMAEAACGRVSEAHKNLAGLIADRDKSPLVARSALALDTLIAAAEYEAVAGFAPRMLILAKRRSVNKKALRDEGAIAKSESRIADHYRKRVKELLAADGSPHFVLFCHDEFDRERLDDFAALDEKCDERIEEAARAGVNSDTTEAELFRPTLITALARYFYNAIGGIRAGQGHLTVLQRADLYGVLAGSLKRPIDSRDKESGWFGDREDVVACAMRALSFRPAVAATSRSRWGEFVFRNEGILSHLGYNANCVKKFDEHWPSWMMGMDPIHPEEKILKDSDVIPPLDPIRALGINDLYSGELPKGGSR